jgi:hypothetical protein
VENKIQNLEDELKVLKNEVQAVLLDIKDFMISSGGIGGGIGLAASEPMGMPPGLGGGGLGDGLSPSPDANPFNLTGGAVQPSPQQVYITQLPTAPAPEPPPPEPPPPVPPSVPALDEEPEPLAVGFDADVSDGAALSFGDDVGSAGMDWGGGAAIQEAPGAGGGPGFGFAGPGEGPGFGQMGPGEGPGFGQMGPGEGSGFGQAGPGAGPDFPQAIRSESADGQLEPDATLCEACDTKVADEVDLPMLAILVPWLSRAVAAVGKENLEKLIELYDVARDVTPRLKEALLSLLAFYDDDSGTGKPSGDAVVMQGIPLLIELDSLLLRHRTGPLESAILSLLQDKMTGKKKTRTRKAGNE